MTHSAVQVSRVPRILIADPDAAARAAYASSFATTGCDVIESDEGRDALVKALVRVPSLVLTELRLPLLDGISLCEILRRDSITSHVPIVVVTAEDNPSALNRVARAGADAVLAKSTPLPELLREIDRLLTRSADLRTRSGEARDRAAVQLARSADLLARSAQHAKPMLSHVHQRTRTTTPPLNPPVVICPECDVPLAYAYSHIGGVSVKNPEQWDYYTCSLHGTFQYRQRTNKLRRVS
jgi:CheY-like chemotaxis protein